MDFPMLLGEAWNVIPSKCHLPLNGYSLAHVRTYHGMDIHMLGDYSVVTYTIYYPKLLITFEVTFNVDVTIGGYFNEVITNWTNFKSGIFVFAVNHKQNIFITFCLDKIQALIMKLIDKKYIEIELWKLTIKVSSTFRHLPDQVPQKLRIVWGNR